MLHGMCKSVEGQPDIDCLTETWLRGDDVVFI